MNAKDVQAKIAELTVQKEAFKKVKDFAGIGRVQCEIDFWKDTFTRMEKPYTHPEDISNINYKHLFIPLKDENNG